MMFAIIPSKNSSIVAIEDVTTWYEKLRRWFDHESAVDYICTTLKATRLVFADSKVQAAVLAMF
jgi:hypothetical protein